VTGGATEHSLRPGKTVATIQGELVLGLGAKAQADWGGGEMSGNAQNRRGGGSGGLKKLGGAEIKVRFRRSGEGRGNMERG